MNLAEVQRRIQEIENSAHDPEVAHGLEDNLYADFVEWVAEEGNHPFALVATQVLRTPEIDFPRWTA